MFDIDLLLLNECCNNKGSRENVIRTSFKKRKVESEQIIKLYKLKRVEAKYIKEYRDFSENSYSKKKIREEEIIFIRKVYIYIRLTKVIEENIAINQEANEITSKIYDDNKYLDVDKKIYWNIFEKYIEEEGNNFPNS